MSKNVHFAIFSGFSASAASVFGKLSGLPTLEGYFLLRILFFICMIICNGAVWTLFVKALQHTNSSLTPTVISSASNYAFSAIIGFLLFEEITSLFWWSGMIFIIAGLLLILSDEKHISTDDIQEKNILECDVLKKSK